MAKPANPVGRPTDYRAEFCNTVINAAPIRSAGATDSAIAAELGVDRVTVFRWRDEHPEFMAACEEAKRIANDRVKQSLFARATGYDNPNAVKIFMPQGAKDPVYAPFTEHYPPDVGAAFNWLKNREPAEWRDRVEHTGADGGPLEITWMTPQIAPAGLPVQPGDNARDVTPAKPEAIPAPALLDGEATEIEAVEVEWSVTSDAKPGEDDA